MTNGQQANKKKQGYMEIIMTIIVDYEDILLLKTIYDMHRYLMIKPNIIIP